MKLLLSLMLLSFYTSARAGGTTVGNGGAFGLCEDQGTLLFQDTMVVVDDYQPVREIYSWRTNFDYIFARLQQLQPNVASNFSDYFQAVLLDSLGSHWSWQNWEGLPLMENLQLEASLRPLCKITHQAILRFGQDERNRNFRYYFDAKLIDQVLRQPDGQLQVSYLLLHEWLWQYFEDPVQLARVNQIMHSLIFDSMTSTEFSVLIGIASGG